MNPDDELPDSVCDRCAEPVASTESQPGHPGTEWESCNLCNDCYAETKPE